MSQLQSLVDDFLAQKRIAVVGEERWRDEMMAFLMAPFRAAEVRYFTSEELAKAEAWLAA